MDYNIQDNCQVYLAVIKSAEKGERLNGLYHVVVLRLNGYQENIWGSYAKSIATSHGSIRGIVPMQRLSDL